MRVEAADQGEDAIVVVRRREVELGALQPATRRVGVDAEQLADPRLAFEVNGDPRPEVAAHPAHEDTRRPAGHVALGHNR